MRLSTDGIILWQHGFFKLNGTIVITWGIMLALTLFSILITRKLSITDKRSRWQNGLEIIVIQLEQQIKEVGLWNARRYLPFLGSIFLFIAFSNLATILPYYEPPTGSLSTTAALAISVFIAVPLFGIWDQGLWGYIKTYFKPSFVMMPFNIIGEVTRTLALAMRLFGNMMSGTMNMAILISVIPWIFPIFMQVLGLISGMVQAYIFTILSTVYIAAATRSRAVESQ